MRRREDYAATTVPAPISTSFASSNSNSNSASQGGYYRDYKQDAKETSYYGNAETLSSSRVVSKDGPGRGGFLGGSRSTNDNSNSYSSSSYSSSRGSNRPNNASNFINPNPNNIPIPPLVKIEYKEHEEISSTLESQIQAYRHKHEMTVTGRHIPHPISNFNHAPFPSVWLKKLQEFSEPTAIQAQGWPVALQGRNMIGIAQTGSGKTLSFILPALVHIKNQEREGSIDPYSKMPIALVMAPTRELACQIHEVARSYGNAIGIISACIYGGSAKGNQLRMLKGAGLVIATPGRLIDFLEAGEISLARCSFVVLDEADRMLDMGFEPQLRQVIPKVRREHQMLLWSATWPKEVQKLARDFLGQGSFAASTHSVSDIVHITIGGGGDSDRLTANKKIKQHLILVERGVNKEAKLAELLQKIWDSVSEPNERLRRMPRTIIFTNTKRVAEDLCYKMQMDNWASISIHGDKSQQDREQALRQFKSGSSPILVATDVAARGLDIKDVRIVINFDIPASGAEDYVHRIGRTARGSDMEGYAYTLVEPSEGALIGQLVNVIREAGQDVDSQIASLIPYHSKYGGGREMGNSRYSRYGRGGGSGSSKYFSKSGGGGYGQNNFRGGNYNRPY